MKTTEKQTAKKFNLYSREDLPAVYTQPQVLSGSIFDYSERVNTAKIDLPNDILLKFNPILLFEAREQMRDNKAELYYIEHFYTCFFSPKGNICILRYNSKNKKYYFMPHFGYYREVQNIEYNRRKEIKKQLCIELKEPQYIGVFNEKKVNDWLNYCDNEIEANKKVVDFGADKNTAIVEEIENFIKKSGGQVSRWGENTEVKTKHFRVVFTHYKESQYLSKKIDFCGSLDNVIELDAIN